MAQRRTRGATGDEDRYFGALERYYGQLTEYLMGFEFGVAKGGELQKAEIARQVLEGRVKASGGPEDPLARFFSQYEATRRRLNGSPEDPVDGESEDTES